jgi:hypothetical protein
MHSFYKFYAKKAQYERTLLMYIGYSSYGVGVMRDQSKTKLTFWKLKWIYIVYDHFFPHGEHSVLHLENL